MKFIVLCLVVSLSYHFSDIDTEFMVMSGNLNIERSLWVIFILFGLVIHSGRYYMIIILKRIIVIFHWLMMVLVMLVLKGYNMKFIADNTRVIGLFKDEAIIGKVESSRVYGKRIIYTVNLDNPITLRWRTDPVYTLLMSDHEILPAPILWEKYIIWRYYYVLLLVYIVPLIYSSR